MHGILERLRAFAAALQVAALLVPVLLIPPLLVPRSVSAQEGVRFSGRDWTIRGEFRQEEYLGRPAILMGNTFMTLDDETFANGTIEFDVSVAGPRSFMGVAFRLQDDGSYEDFYLRPHQTGRFDALQYTPVWHNASAWQLYPEHNATFEIPRGEWLHVRLEVTDGRLEAYLGEAREPAMVVERLRGPDAPGRLALKSFFPAAGEEPGVLPNAFSSFRVSPGSEKRPRDPEALPGEAGVIARWEVSQSFPGSPGPVATYPSRQVGEATWTTVRTDARGRVNLAELEGIPPEEQTGLKLARVVLTSDSARDVTLGFGASDRVSIFLDRRLLFTGDNTYRSRSLRYLGVMTQDNDALRLRLAKGDNELLFAVTEAFGGWGLNARLSAEDGAPLPLTRP